MVARQFRQAAVAIAMGVGMSVPAAAGESEPLKMAVSVFADTKVPADVLESAKAETTEIFARLGIELVWRATSPARDVRLTIRVIDGTIKGAGKSAMGLAVPNRNGPGSSLYALLGRVEAFAAHHGRPVAQILGHVIAHEVGHLLLPTAAHATGCIMVARWDRQQLEQLDRGWLTFTHEEVEDIRRSVRNWEVGGKSRAESVSR
jgi:hypothetical protein